jgi:hypothetical protein
MRAVGFGCQGHRKEPSHCDRREDMNFVSEFPDGLYFQVTKSDSYTACSGHVSSSRMLPWYLWRTSGASDEIVI